MRTLLIDVMKYTFNIVIRQDTYDLMKQTDNVHLLIWFQLGMIVDTIELSILILVSMTLTFVQGHRNARKQKLMCQLFYKVLIDLDGIQYSTFVI